MKLPWILGLIVLMSCESPVPKYIYPSAKQAPKKTSALAIPTKSAEVSVALPVTPPEDTNSISSTTFAWDYPDLTNIQYFELHEGSVSGSYTNVINVGLATSYSLRRTNWSEESVRHFYVVTAVNVLAQESDYSNQIHNPLYPPDHYRLTWLNPQPATILTCGTLKSPWVVLNRTQSGTTAFSSLMMGQSQFFNLVRSNGLPDTLTVTCYNPLNL